MFTPVNTRTNYSVYSSTMSPKNKCFSVGFILESQKMIRKLWLNAKCITFYIYWSIRVVLMPSKDIFITKDLHFHYLYQVTSD
jgi:hypothetical protein